MIVEISMVDGPLLGCFDNSPQYDSPSSDTGAIHLISLTQTSPSTMRVCL
jgi:hypothetical protein